MAYFVRIGAFKGNQSGVNARGYHLFRTGTVVTVRWGAVCVLPDCTFVWAWKKLHERKYRCGSVARAVETYRTEVRHRTVRQKYDRLPSGVKILRRALQQ